MIINHEVHNYSFIDNYVYNHIILLRCTVYKSTFIDNCVYKFSFNDTTTPFFAKIWRMSINPNSQKKVPIIFSLEILYRYYRVIIIVDLQSQKVYKCEFIVHKVTIDWEIIVQKPSILTVTTVREFSVDEVDKLLMDDLTITM